MITVLVVLVAGCPKPRPCPTCPSSPRPAATIVVAPDPLPCELARMPDPLGPTNGTPIPAGRWRLVDDDGRAVLDDAGKTIERVLSRGIHAPRDRWDAIALYINALQGIAVDAKRCHPDPAPTTSPGAAP